MNKLIVFQSDFGLVDGAVSAMHGVANVVDNSLKIYDLTHDIPQYSIWDASYRLFQTTEYWPEGTVFVSVVDPGDSGYRKFLSRLSIPLMERLQPGQKGLDFGCGPGPTLSVMMEEAGYKMELYDPFYYPDRSVLDKSYDFVTSTEVVEHLQNPEKVFSHLFHILNPGGILGLMTKMVVDSNVFKTWHYIQDSTHICFYSRETFEYISDWFSADVEFIGNDVIILKNRSDLLK